MRNVCVAAVVKQPGRVRKSLYRNEGWGIMWGEGKTHGLRWAEWVARDQPLSRHSVCVCPVTSGLWKAGVPA